MPGKVYLVGAGPGDPELLTLKALRVLKAADVVLHDALIGPEILSRGSPDGLRIRHDPFVAGALSRDARSDDSREQDGDH